MFAVNPSDWRYPKNDNLWQGVSGVNNPCPSGFRLPTDTELNTERASWSSDNAAGAFGSPLKLVAAGYRFYRTGALDITGSDGYYWSSTVKGNYIRDLGFHSSGASIYDSISATGRSVRCIKD